MILLDLFWAFFRVGLFSVGGGYAAMPLIQNQAVNVHAWISDSIFTDLVAIAEMTPGPIALNAATFVGMKTAGYPGAILATLGCIAPSIIIVTILAKLYLRFKSGSALENVLSCLRPAVVGLIAAAFVTILVTALFGDLPAAFSNVDWGMLALFAAAATLIIRFTVNPVLSMLMCGCVYLLSGIVFGM